jgi:hypothetical protein
MRKGIGTWRRAAVLLLTIVVAGALAACGSSSSGSSNAESLLKQTFSGSHTVNSGVLTFSLSATPQGSSTIKGPITLSLDGPFQSRGHGKLPESNLNISIDALGHHGQLGIVSTGTNGYITLDGVAYQLPAADYQKLATSFSSAGSGAGGLGKLGIHPLDWLTNPTVVGNESVAGASTTHIRAGVNVSALLDDLSTFLGKASATGASSSIPSGLSASTKQKIAAAIKSPTVDVWTGASDKTLRKLSVNLNVPVTGQVSTLLGGMSSAGIGLTLQYADLNQPQTVAAPTNVQPFSQFAPKLEGILHNVESEFGASGLGGSASSGSSSSGSGASSGSSSSTNVSKYSQCIQQAAGDVTKMQKCASLLNGSGG